jgi:hypothetical protein
MKQKKLNRSTIILAILLVNICFVSGIVSVNATKPTRPPLFDELLERGWRINVFNGNPWQGMGIPVPIDEYTYVHHGFASDSWKTMSSAQKREFFDTAVFELEIDGVAVELESSKWFGLVPSLGTNEMWLIFWIEFEPYTFDAGFHTFSGRWYVEVNGIPDLLETSWEIKFVDPSV